jgi:hypothetical protein
MSRDFEEKNSVRWKDGVPLTADRRYGTKADPDPFREATIRVPEFLRLEKVVDLNTLANVLRSPLATRIYILMLCGADFHTGELTTTYKRFVALCTEPKPERGPRPPPPTYWQVRRAIEQLIEVGLVARDPTSNEALQQLRIAVIPRAKATGKKARPQD